MFGIGAGEFVLIMIVGLIVFGPSKLPEIGRSVGKLLREFRKAQATLSATLSEPDEEQKPKSKVQTSKTEIQEITQNNSSASQSTLEKSPAPNKSKSIEEVTEMINSNPIVVPQSTPASKVNLSKKE